MRGRGVECKGSVRERGVEGCRREREMEGSRIVGGSGVELEGSGMEGKESGVE